MALTDILKKIEADSAKRIKEVEAEGKKMGDAVRKEFAEKERAMKDKYAAEGKREREKLLRGTETEARMRGKHLVLTSKRKLLDGAFESAINSLAGDKHALEKIFRAIEAHLPTDGSLVAPKGLKEALSSLVHGGKSSAQVDKEGSFSNGLIFIGKNSELDATAETLLKNIRPQLEPEVSTILFS